MEAEKQMEPDTVSEKEIVAVIFSTQKISKKNQN